MPLRKGVTNRNADIDGKGREEMAFHIVFKEIAGHFGGNTHQVTGDVVKDKNRDIQTWPLLE